MPRIRTDRAALTTEDVLRLVAQVLGTVSGETLPDPMTASFLNEYRRHVLALIEAASALRCFVANQQP